MNKGFTFPRVYPTGLAFSRLGLLYATNPNWFGWHKADKIDK